jgi:two-component system CheB/CheR fusion protein
MVPLEDRAFVNERLDAAIRGTAQYDVVHRMVRPDGRVIYVQAQAEVKRDKDGTPLQMLGTVVDVTERIQADEAMHKADRRKNEFLAILGHELRNPLAALSMGLQLARRGQSEPTLKQRLDMMDRQLSHLMRLVDDLLDVGRISVGKIELRLEPLTLPEVLKTSWEEVRAAVESRRHQLEIEIRPGQHLVRGDSARLTQVIANLIENAAKYTESGGQIRVSLSQEDSAEVVRVEDSGIGIPADELPHVFDLFSQVRAHQGTGAGGLGIGLAIVRTLVELHGGTIDAASAGIGRGSTFTVRLPVLERTTSMPVPKDLPQERVKETHPRRRVLIVDDNEELAASLAEILHFDGHQTWIAHDGLMAIEIAKITKLDVVLIDLGMPGLNGIETAKRIRALPGCERLPIAAITGWGQESDRVRTQEAGFDWHLVKPIDTELLTRIIEMLEPRRA